MGVRSGRGRAVLIGILLLPILFVAYQIGRLVWANSHYKAALRAVAQRDFPLARQHLSQCMRVYPSDPETLLLACQTARRAGEVGEAGRLLRACVEANVVPEAVDLERRLLRYQTGDLTDAEVYAHYCADHPQSPQTPLLLEALIIGGLRAMNLPLASRCVDLWLEQQTGVAEQVQGYVWRGDVAVRTGGYKRAMADYRKAVELDPDSELAHRRLGELLPRYSPQEAVKQLRWLLDRNPTDRSARLHLARCHRFLGEHEEARALLGQLLAEDRDDFAALLEAGQVELDLGQLAEAERRLRRAESLEPDRRELTLALSRCLHLAGKEAEAKLYQDKLAQIDAAIERRIDQMRPAN